MCDEGAYAPTLFPNYKIQRRIKGQCRKLQSYSGHGGVRMHKVPPPRAARGNWGIISAIRRRVEFRKAACVGGFPLWGGAPEDIPGEAVRLLTGILGIQTPRIPFSEGAAGQNSQMRRANTQTPRGVHSAIFQIRVLEAPCYWTRLHCSDVFRVSTRRVSTAVLSTSPVRRSLKTLNDFQLSGS